MFFKSSFFIDILASTKVTSSKTKTATAVGITFAVLVGIVVVIAVTLFMLKRSGKINSYLPTVLMKKIHNIGKSKDMESELSTIVNKNFD